MTDKNKPAPIEDKDLEKSSGGAIQPVRKATPKMDCSNTLYSATPTTSATLKTG